MKRLPENNITKWYMYLVIEHKKTWTHKTKLMTIIVETRDTGNTNVECCQ